MTIQLQPQTLRGILQRALIDDELLKQFADDPLGTLKSSGVELNFASMKSWLGVPCATDRELVQMLCNLLRARDCGGG
jgi:hypothetical protein